ncbi:hypothetical protein C4K24_3455 [Pseudomonas chlororaphis subsp. aurantiaca]|nr:hypothetical protein C4K24_3455 [Pseudomonas chlororaphis subsp. aurantiaca]
MLSWQTSHTVFDDILLKVIFDFFESGFSSIRYFSFVHLAKVYSSIRF